MDEEDEDAPIRTPRQKTDGKKASAKAAPACRSKGNTKEDAIPDSASKRRRRGAIAASITPENLTDHAKFLVEQEKCTSKLNDVSKQYGGHHCVLGKCEKLLHKLQGNKKLPPKANEQVEEMRKTRARSVPWWKSVRTSRRHN